MTEKIVEVNLWAGWESCQPSNMHCTQRGRFTVCALLQASLCLSCLQWLTEDLARPTKTLRNTVRESSARHEIDFVLTNKGICFSHTVNQIISRNEGKMRVKSLTSNSKSGSLPTCCPINPETCSIAN